MSGGDAAIVVGLGLRGRQWLRALRRTPGLTPAGTVDPDPGAARVSAEAGLEHWTGVRDALDRARPRLAVIAAPAPQHAELAVACLEAGCAVLVEKPLAPSLAEARRVAETAERAGVPALAAQNFRFRGVELTVARALERGRVGAPRSASIVSARAADDGIPAYEHAPLWEFCVHHVDLWRSRLGQDPEEVHAERAGDGSYLLRLAFPEGLEVRYRHREGAPVFHWYEWIEGERGALAVELERVRLHSPRHRPRRVRAVRGPAPERALLDAARGALASGDAGALSAAANLGTIAALEAAGASLGSGRPERVAVR